MKKRNAMRKIEILAIKYLIIGLGVGLLNFLLVVFHKYFLVWFSIDSDPSVIINALDRGLIYLDNVIVGLFILFDSIRSVRNKILISLLGFVLPMSGICFLLLENFLILKTVENEQ
jgi:hypothetical protein